MPKPSPIRCFGAGAIRLIHPSTATDSGGTSRTIPTSTRVTIAMYRFTLSGSPSAEMTYARTTTEIVNVATRPTTIPSGRRRPPDAPPASTIGRTGRTHGETAVAAPATKPKRMRSSI